MKKISDLLNEYEDKCFNISELVYKYKKVEPHKIEESFDKYAKENDFLIFGTSEKWYIDLKGVHDYFYSLKDMGYTTPKLDIQAIAINEVFNSQWLEGGRSSKKVIGEIINGKRSASTDANRLVINHYNALCFVLANPEFNEMNLRTLYFILTASIDMGKETLDGDFYRKGDVEIQNSIGVHSSKIKENMDAIFDLAYKLNDYGNVANGVLMIFFIHYWFEQIHPYYDFNGRMGRLIIIWMQKIYQIENLFGISETINLFKDEFYYSSFKNSKLNDFRNDGTYFVSSMVKMTYLSSIVNDVTLYVVNQMNTKKISVNNLEIDAIKFFLAHEFDKFYEAKEFVKGYEDTNKSLMSISLNKLVDFGFLIELNSKPKKYKLNFELIKDELNKYKK